MLAEIREKATNGFAGTVLFREDSGELGVDADAPHRDVLDDTYRLEPIELPASFEGASRPVFQPMTESWFKAVLRYRLPTEYTYKFVRDPTDPRGRP